MSTWTEQHPYAAARSRLTARAVDWAVDALRHDDTTVSAIARHLGVAWDTCWAAIKARAEELIKIPQRAAGVKTIGVDEHIWRPSKISSIDKAVTVMVDLTRDEHGCLDARLLDAVQGRSGKVFADWLAEQGVEVTVTIEHAALDEVRRRVQQATLGRRGHKEDPLYRIRRTLLTGREHLTNRQRGRFEKWLPVGDPDGEVELAWTIYQEVRAIYHATTPATGREHTEKLLKTLLEHDHHLIAEGQVILGDKGFAGKEFEAFITGRLGAHLIRPDRKDEKKRFGKLAPIRQRIESVFDTLKGQLGLEQHGGRTLAGVYARVAARLLALATAIWHNWKTGQSVKRSLVAYDH